MFQCNCWGGDSIIDEGGEGIERGEQKVKGKVGGIVNILTKVEREREMQAMLQKYMDNVAHNHVHQGNAARNTGLIDALVEA